MVNKYRIVARVVHQNGSCSMGHRIGDEFIIDDSTPSGICSWAFYSIFPFYTVLKYGGSLPWENNPDRALIACPDPLNTVHFELERQKVNI